MSSTTTDDTDSRDDSVRRLDGTGYGGGHVETPTLEVSPITETAGVELQPWGDEVSLVVDVLAPGDVWVRSTATLTRGEVRQLRDDLDVLLQGGA